MKIIVQFLLITFFLPCTLTFALGKSKTLPGQNGVGKFNHVVMVVLENIDYEDAIKDPFLQSLNKQGTHFSQFNGVTHPSYPNYLAMIGGSIFGAITNIQKTISDPSIADLLEAKGLSWKNYAEGYPGNCFLKDTQGRYVRKHVPFLSFKSVQNNPTRCEKVVNADEFQKDWRNNELPNYSIYTPDLDNDGHDTGLAYASNWLKGFLSPLLVDKEKMKGTLFIITFDEADSLVNNHIYTTFVGPSVKADHSVSTEYNHYDVLKMIEDNFSLGNLGENDKEAKPITGVWVEQNGNSGHSH